MSHFSQEEMQLARARCGRRVIARARQSQHEPGACADTVAIAAIGRAVRAIQVDRTAATTSRVVHKCGPHLFRGFNVMGVLILPGRPHSRGVRPSSVLKTLQSASGPRATATQAASSSKGINPKALMPETLKSPSTGSVTSQGRSVGAMLISTLVWALGSAFDSLAVGRYYTTTVLLLLLVFHELL